MTASHSTSTPESLWTPEETAAFLSLEGDGTRTLAQWRWRGFGPAFVKVGRLVRYSPETVRAWVESQTHSSTASYSSPALSERGCTPFSRPSKTPGGASPRVAGARGLS